MTAIGRRPTIAVVHDIPDLISRAAREVINPGRRAIEFIRKQLRLRMLRRCAVVVCNSDFTATKAVQEYGLDPSRVRVAYCGVDERFFTPPRTTVQEWTSVQHPYLLAFATGDHRERFDLIPEIFSIVRAAVPALNFVIAGVDMQKPYVRSLLQEFATRGAVIGRDVTFVPFLGEGQFDRLHSLYCEAAFYVELSAHEGFGMSLAEAMACGTACVTSGAGALNEVGGGYPIKAVGHDARSFAEAIIAGYQKGIHLHRNSEQIEFCRRYSWSKVGTIIAKELRLLDRGPREIAAHVPHC